MNIVLTYAVSAVSAKLRTMGTPTTPAMPLPTTPTGILSSFPPWALWAVAVAVVVYHVLIGLDPAWKGLKAAGEMWAASRSRLGYFRSPLKKVWRGTVWVGNVFVLLTAVQFCATGARSSTGWHRLVWWHLDSLVLIVVCTRQVRNVARLLRADREKQVPELTNLEVAGPIAYGFIIFWSALYPFVFPPSH